ncbi:hypothetical protein F8S20_25855 [Nostoc sp. BAE]|nr:hypothetical protein [Nostoc commune BAE]
MLIGCYQLLKEKSDRPIESGGNRHQEGEGEKRVFFIPFPFTLSPFPKIISQFMLRNLAARKD